MVSRTAMRQMWRTKHRTQRQATTALGLLAAMLVGTIATVGTAAAQSAEPAFALPTRPDAVVVRMREIIPSVAESNGPSITIFASGRVLVEYPETMKRAGRYELQLSPEQLRAQVQEWLETGVAEFDEAQTRQARVDAIRRQNVMTVVSDPTTTVVEMNLASYRATGAGARAASAPLAKEIRWSALRSDSKRYTEVASLQALSSVCRDLEALMQSPSLVEVP